MSSIQKIYFSILSGLQDTNTAFRDLQRLLEKLGFQYRVNGDHFIYWKNGIVEIINIQPDGNKAKPYQVKQVRMLILKYHLEVNEND